MRNIYLVGFMGTGKTAVGRVLADKLSRRFVEMDQLIEKQENKEIKDIFAENGQEYFRKLENQLLKKLSSQSNLVVSCGGGVVCNQDNLDILQNTGYVFSLSASPNSIFERIKGSNHRPLLNGANPLEKIKELLEIRKLFYKKAGIKIDTDNLSVEDVADYILKLLENG
ncbi:MAG: shikimate kinase [Candidatus Omnitrophica bacterium]|nr:shikimate kinase [Candidatus Omnitrophota bacterium]MCF7893528.1 shikimate kinase [Candidatus Omnitrophota bacterium]